MGSTIQTRSAASALPPSSSPSTWSSGKAAATCWRTIDSIEVSAWVTTVKSALRRISNESPWNSPIPMSAARSASPPANERSCSYMARSLPARARPAVCLGQNFE